jgi:hypothetical protein
MLMYYARMFWNSFKGKENTPDLDDVQAEVAP